MVINSGSPQYTQTIKRALKALGKEHFFIILPCLSFPSSSDRDTGVGTAYSDYARDFILYLGQYGINGIQFMPSGISSIDDSSPYSSSLFSDNFLFIDLFKLTGPSYASILSKDIFYDIVKENTSPSKDRIAYKYVYKRYMLALKEAYISFRALSSSISNRGLIFALSEEFRSFVNSNMDWLYTDALFYGLSLKYSSEDWSSWDYIDRVLCLSFVHSSYSDDSGAGNKSYLLLRREEIEDEFCFEIDFYNFVQFICYKQRQEFKVFAKDNDFSLIADSQVALSGRDFWANQDIFLDNYCLGVPPDYFSETGQAWGFPVLDADKLFGNDGSLARAGLFLRRKFLKIFRENNGVRLDHIIGLIDPWVYRCNDSNDARLEGGRLFSSPDLPHLAKYSYVDLSDLNPELSCELSDEARVESLSGLQIERYGAILKNILFRSAYDVGRASDFMLICEDLGTLTYPVSRVMEEYGLSGIRVTEFVDPLDANHIYRGTNVSTDDWIVLGTHDNDSLINWSNSLSMEERAGHISMLIDDLLFYEASHIKDRLSTELLYDDKFFMTLKFAELFASASAHIEVMFTDFFGISERYNKPSTVSDLNWSLRLSNLSMEGDIFWDLPYILYLAFRARGDEFIDKHRAIFDSLLLLF